MRLRADGKGSSDGRTGSLRRGIDSAGGIRRSYGWVTDGVRREAWLALAEAMGVSLSVALDWVFDAGMGRLDVTAIGSGSVAGVLDGVGPASEPGSARGRDTTPRA